MLLHVIFNILTGKWQKMGSCPVSEPVHGHCLLARETLGGLVSFFS